MSGKAFYEVASEILIAMIANGQIAGVADVTEAYEAIYQQLCESFNNSR